MKMPDTNEQALSNAVFERTVAAVVIDLCCRPKECLLLRWNWKAALLSSMLRASLFFLSNLAYGTSAAVAAMSVEFSYRAVVSGFYGGITESFRFARPPWLAMTTVVLTMPLLNHGAEFILHWSLGTPNLKASIMASMAFTVLSTGFNLHAMRHDALITRHNPQSLLQDMKRIPGLLLSFIVAVIRLFTGRIVSRK